jgi:hypothetical protein
VLERVIEGVGQGAGGADIGRKYRLTADAGPAPAAMARDLLDDFEIAFPGAKAAFNGPGLLHLVIG